MTLDDATPSAGATRAHPTSGFAHASATVSAHGSGPARALASAATTAPRAAQPAWPWRPAPRPQPRPGDTFAVGNAGLVLLAGFTPRLFAMRELLAPDRRAFANEPTAGRAVHLLQWLVTERSDTDEPELVLPKLLCGLPPAAAVPPAVALRPEDTEAGLALLRGVLEHWRALGRTSVAGLRESFLQREGRLLREDAGWRLTVAPRAFDLLLDRLPWGIGVIRLPWMTEVLHVDWR